MRARTESTEPTTIQSYSYPREWERLILPDPADVLKEIWKYAWRRAVFYVALLGLVAYISQFPRQLEGIFTWIWIANVLWFELDVTSTRNNVLIQLLHGFSFIGSFLGAILLCLVLLYLPNYVLTRPDSAGSSSPIMAWLLTAWINFSPPLWATIDLYLHRSDLIQRHKLTLPPARDRPLKIARVVVQTTWLFLCFPLLTGIWLVLNSGKYQHEQIRDTILENQSVFLPSLIISNFVIALVMLLVLRKVPKNGSKTSP